jgi:signal peptidase I
MAEETKTFLPRWLQIVLIGRRPRYTVLRIAVIVAVVFLTARYLVWPLRVQGPSMAPTYRENGINFLNRLSYVFHEPRRGDIVAIRLAGRSVMFMKRVVGLPGETVEFIDGQLYVDGQPLPEPYVQFPCRWNRRPRKLDLNEYFVVGDNRSMHIDDHEHGAAKRERILGKVLL